MSQQNQTTFTMRIAQSDTSYGEGTQSCRATADVNGGTPTIDLAAAYRNSRQASQYSLSSMRGLSSSRFSSSMAYVRRAA